MTIAGSGSCWLVGWPGTGGGALTLVSPGAKRRPCSGGTPSALSRCSSIAAVRTRSGRSPAVRFASPVVNAPTAANDRFISRNSMYSGGDTQNCENPNDGNWVVRYINWSGLGYASGRRITPLTIEKMAVFAPMPRASVRSAVIVNPGERQSSRTPYFTSGTIALVQPSHFMDDLL